MLEASRALVSSSVPADSTSAPLPSTTPAWLAPSLTSTVSPAPMHATSEDAGTSPVDQSAAVCQLPSLGPVQVFVQSGSADAPAAIVRQASRAAAAATASRAPTEPFRGRFPNLPRCPSPPAGPCDDISTSELAHPLGGHRYEGRGPRTPAPSAGRRGHYHRPTSRSSQVSKNFTQTARKSSRLPSPARPRLRSRRRVGLSPRSRRTARGRGRSRV